MDEPGHDRDSFEAVAESFLARYRAGDRPSLHDLAARHPEFSDQIREVMPGLVRAEQDRTIDRDHDQAREPSSLDATSTGPRQVGDYRVIREIGRGGMGVVYEADQISLGRRVALKILPAHVANDSKALQRFRREAKAAARLHHTNIVPVFEVGRDGDIAYYAMQFISGQGLDRVIDELRRRAASDRTTEPPWQAGAGPSTEPLVHPENGRVGRAAEALLSGRLGIDVSEVSASVASTVCEESGREPLGTDASSVVDFPDSAIEVLSSLPEPDTPISPAIPVGAALTAVGSSGRRRPFFRNVADIGRQAAQGLAYAHSRGTVHRDVKPSNLLLDGAGVVWIADFGLAKAEDDGQTATGDLLGTLRYMAPERFQGECDARADIYALGLSLYELLTLRPAFDSSDRLNLIGRIKNEDPPRPRSLDRGIPGDLETIILKSIEKAPERRYASAEAMAEDLRRFLDDEPIQARRTSVFERYARWARRNPGIAVLGAVLTAVLVLATLGSLAAARRFHDQAEIQRSLADESEAQRREADQARQEQTAARRNADQANALLRVREEELRQTIYATRSNLALSAWETNDIGRLRTLLGLMRPSPGEPDPRGWEWRLLWKLGHEDRLTLRSDGGEPFRDVVFSPDGQTLASLERRGRIQLWDRHSGEPLRATGVTKDGLAASLGNGVGCIAFSPDGRTVAGPGPDASLVLYAVDTGLPVLRFQGYPGAVLGLAFSPDGETLVAALSTHVMRVWNARDGHLIHNNFGAHRGPVADVAFSPDGRTLASAGFDHAVKLWNPEAPAQPPVVLSGHTDEVLALAFSPDGRRIASTGFDRSVRIWDAHSGEALSVIWGHTSSVLSVAFLADNERIVTGSTDETVRVWNAASGQELRTFKATDEIVSVAVSPDGLDVASAGDTTVRVWAAGSPPRPRTLRSPSVLVYGGRVLCLAFSPGGRRLASGHDDGALRIWDLLSDDPPRVLRGHKGDVHCIAFSPDGGTIASGGQDRSVNLWDAESGELRSTYDQHIDEVGDLVFTPDGQMILSSGLDHSIQAWDVTTGVERYVLRGHTDTVPSLALSPDGRTLASSSYDRTCILWDLAERRALVTLRGHSDDVNGVAFSFDGRTVATGSDDQTVRLWGAATGALLGILKGHRDGIKGLAFSPDGRLASSGWDHEIRIWDTVSGQALLGLKGHSGRIPDLEFSPDGRTLASAGYDRTIKLWEAARTAVLKETLPKDKPAEPSENHGKN